MNFERIALLARYSGIDKDQMNVHLESGKGMIGLEMSGLTHENVERIVGKLADCDPYVMDSVTIDRPTYGSERNTCRIVVGETE